MDNDRRIAFLTLKDIEEKGVWSNLAAEKRISKEGAAVPAFVREIVYGVLRNRTLLDYNIDKFLKKPKISLSERIWLRMGFYQLALMDGQKDHAAINETVELAKAFKKGSESFINAVLRSFQRKGKTLVYPDKEDTEYLKVRYSVHEDIARLWTGAYGFDACERMLSASNTPAPMCLRINRMKISKDEFIEKLLSEGIEVIDKSGLLSPYAVYVKGSGLLDTEMYKEGLFSVQGESSQYAVRVLGPKPSSTVIDLCAAPGGKSCAMAEMMNFEGKILAFDIYGHRVGLINKEAERLGIDCIETAIKDASVFDPEFESTADYVLADVPCSGLGTLRENPEIKYRKPDKISSQGSILGNALRYVKPGGYVLYSTCTVDPSENEDIVKNCDLVDSHILGTEYIEKEYKVVASRQLMTEKGGHDGFYICLIKRSRP